MIKRSSVVFFMVIEREVTVFEPHYFQTSFQYTWQIESQVIETHETLGGERWLLFDTVEAIIGHEPISSNAPIEQRHKYLAECNTAQTHPTVSSVLFTARPPSQQMANTI